jgi:hypothetical protein
MSDVTGRSPSEVGRSNTRWILECRLPLVAFAVARDILPATIAPPHRSAYTPRARWPANTVARLRVLRVLRGFPDDRLAPTGGFVGAPGFSTRSPLFLSLSHGGERELGPDLSSSLCVLCDSAVRHSSSPYSRFIRATFASVRGSRAARIDEICGPYNRAPHNLQCTASGSWPSAAHWGQAWVETSGSKARANSTVTMPVGTAMMP